MAPQDSPRAAAKSAGTSHPAAGTGTSGVRRVMQGQGPPVPALFESDKAPVEEVQLAGPDALALLVGHWPAGASSGPGGAFAATYISTSIERVAYALNDNPRGSIGW
jgi:hypothetical protein